MTPTNSSTAWKLGYGTFSGAVSHLPFRRNPRIQLVRTVAAPAGRIAADESLKRMLDLVAAIVLIAVLLPLMIVIAVLIKLDSSGPVLFRQVRAGRNGRPFRMCKFRTMTANADATKQALRHLNASGDPRLFKIPNDPRITRVGALLRQSSLDELPQLWNIIRGDMSLVGPRPFFVEDLATYEKHHFRRLEVRPGLTGLWQVNGRSAVTD